ncbi:MAG: Ppx/GppA family phosphatase [Bdellovibrio sp.]|nr:Ppx/GppA family phosphatase [Bdellovibrio sp.]
MKVAALDLGSNTFLCLIAEVSKNDKGVCRIEKIISDQVEIVRLGQDVNKTKRLHPDALIRAKNCLTKFKETIDLYKPEKILAMATSAARDSKNRDELFEIGKALGIPIEVIPGEKEALITYQGSISGQTSDVTRLVVDIGGGSTEFITGDLKQIFQNKSLNIGCVRLTEKFITAQPTSTQEVEAAEKNIIENLNQIVYFNDRQIAEILAVAGTPTALVAAQLKLVEFDANRIDGFQLDLNSLEQWKLSLQKATLQEKVAMGIPEGRADVILIGVLTLIQTLKLFNKNKITVSTRGVRHGIALEMANRFLS